MRIAFLSEVLAALSCGISRGPGSRAPGFKPSIVPWTPEHVAVPYPQSWVIRNPTSPCLLKSNRDEETKQEVGDLISWQVSELNK